MIACDASEGRRLLRRYLVSLLLPSQRGRYLAFRKGLQFLDRLTERSGYRRGLVLMGFGPFLVLCLLVQCVRRALLCDRTVLLGHGVLGLVGRCLHGSGYLLGIDCTRRHHGGS